MIVTKVKVERVKKGLRQCDLAKQANIPPYKYAFFERGEMKLKDVEIERISKILGTEIINPF